MLDLDVKSLPFGKFFWCRFSLINAPLKQIWKVRGKILGQKLFKNHVKNHNSSKYNLWAPLPNFSSVKDKLRLVEYCGENHDKTWFYARHCSSMECIRLKKIRSLFLGKTHISNDFLLHIKKKLDTKHKMPYIAKTVKRLSTERIYSKGYPSKTIIPLRD